MNTDVRLSASSVVTRSREMIQAVVDGEVVMLNVDVGSCFGLNKVGSRIWALIETPARVDDVCATLLSEFEIDEASCRNQVLGLLTELHTEGMLEFSEALREGGPSAAHDGH